MSIIFEKPETLTEETEKPLANENADFPIASIDHRRFEKLTYWIYKKEIEIGSWKTQFDEIRLMSGVRDGGKDCALFLNKKMIGVIQCKHSEKDTALSSPILLKEVVKFCLYQIKYKNVIPDIDDFVYYIASSSGFNEACLTFIQNFNKESVAEPKLKSWTENVIKSYSAIEDLIYNDIETELKDILSELKIKQIDNSDINIILNKSYQIDSQKAFFTVRTVVDISALKPIEEKLTALVEKKLTNEEALLAFKSASSYLINWKNYISEDKKIQIQRSQTQDLYNWIKGGLKLKEDPIALLTGMAGAGKTVVLKNLYDKLVAEEFIVLGIKADKYYADNIEGLERQLDIREPIINLIYKLKEDNEKIIILIDQIDALSQALASDRKFLATYNLLIQKLITIPGVRVIVSVREFDLNYDPELSIYKKATKIGLGLLSDEEVKDVLLKLGIDVSLISPKLFNTLKTPHHLEVFSSIYSKQIGLESITELQDLYHELWKQKVLTIKTESPATKENCVNLIYAVSQQMMDTQKISLNLLPYENNFQNEIQYLTSQNIFIISGKELQFFHQTFFDYCYARNFVEKSDSVIDFVLKNNQSLHIRSSLKMIISYLRISEEKKYINSIQQLFSKSEIRFHIKLLIINLLGFNNTPSEAEKNFVLTTLLKNEIYKRLFIESSFGETWIKFLIETKTLDSLIYITPNKLDKFLELSICNKTKVKSIFENYFGYKTYLKRHSDNLNLFFNTIGRALPDSRQTVNRYLLNMLPFEENARVMTRLIYSIKKWDHPEAFLLYEKYKLEIEEDIFGFSHILEDILHYNPDWVIMKFGLWLDTLLSENETKKHIDYNINKLYETIAKTKPEQVIDLGLRFIKKKIDQRKFRYKDNTLQLFEDSEFHFYDHDKERHGGTKEIYSDTIEAIELLSKNQSPRFYGFITDCKSENSISILNILVWGFLSNPVNYLREIVDFIVYFESKGGFIRYEKINFWIRKLLAVAYPLMDAAQKNTIHHVALSIIKNEKPILYVNQDGTKSHYLGSFGRHSYIFLSVLPEVNILSTPSLKKKYLELKRKFGIQEDVEPNIIRVRGVPAPLHGNAYVNMDLNNWKNSMLKYDNDNFDPFSNRGNLLEHSRRFHEEVKQNPYKYSALIENLIDGDEVHKDYIIKGIEGLKDAQYSAADVKRLFDKIILKDLDQSNKMFLCWLTDYFIKNKQIDKTLIDFLYTTYQKSEKVNEENETDLIMRGINSTRGAALEKLLMCHDSIFIDIVFKAAEEAANDPQSSIRAVLLRQLAYLLKYDKKRTTKVFITATAEADERLLSASIHCLNYIVHHEFEMLLPYLKKWIAVASIEKEISGIIINCWLNGYQGSEPLLFNLLKRSVIARTKAVEWSYSNMFHDKQEVRDKCKYLFVMLLKDSSEEVSHEFERMFFEIEKQTFLKWYPLLQLYYKSKVVKKNPHHFFTYLLSNTFLHPKECLELISNYQQYEKPNMQAGPYYNEEPVSIVLNCYNSFLNSAETGHMEKCISLFDSMLKTDYLRKGAYSALHLADR